MAIPARSVGAGRRTRYRESGCVVVRTLLTTTVAWPVPILHAARGSPLAGGGVWMHWPPSIDALDSSPGGRISLRFLTVSLEVGAKATLVPSATEEPAWVPAL